MQSFLSYLTEKPAQWRAGGLPFVQDRGQVWVCVFVSNDPQYGGSAPQLAKGQPNAHERPVEAAIREVSEETGIPPQLLGRRPFPLSIRTMIAWDAMPYDIHAYGFPMTRLYAPRPNAEGTGKWMPADQALRVMRRDHRVFVRDLLQQLRHSIT